MATKYGEAGTGAREMAKTRRLAILGFVGICLLFVLIFATNLVTGLKFGLPTLFFLIVALKVFEKYADKKTDELSKRAKDAEKGAIGEEQVGEALAKLPDGFEIYNDVQFDGFNIDHVVASPAGVFLIETKSHEGKVLNDGDALILNGAPEKDFLNQTWRQTYRLHDYLKEKMDIDVKVKPILCFSSAFVEVRKPVKGIVVVNKGYLGKYLSKQQGQGLSPQILSRIRVALKRKI